MRETNRTKIGRTAAIAVISRKLEKFARHRAVVTALVGLMLATAFTGCIGKKTQKEPGAEIKDNVPVEIVGNGLIIRTGAVEIAINLEKGRFDFLWGDGRISNAVAGACIGGSWFYSPDYENKTWEKHAFNDKIGAGQSVEIFFNSKEKPTLVQNITVYPAEGYVLLRLSVKNSLSSPITITALRPLEINPAYEGNAGFAATEGTVLALVNGYHSWDYAGVVRVTGTAVNQDIALPYLPASFSTSNATSWWMQAVYDELSEVGYTAGALTAKKWKTTVSYKIDEGLDAYWDVQCGGAGEKIILPPDNATTSELIYIGASKGAGNVLKNLEEYAGLSGIMMDARHVFAPPVGWCSWYYYFDAVTEQNVIDNAKAMKELSYVNYEYVQIDDGWQGLWGDWRANSKFPDGMDGTARRIHELGFKAGIWLAPFLMNPNAPFAKEHPDAFIKDESGNYVTYGADDGSAHWCIDATHPEGQNFLHETFKNVSDWGYDYIKIDFLFAGAYEGVHYDNSKTGTEALRLGLEIIREAMGNDAYIDGCGAPMLPGVGIFDGNRIGGDICFGMVYDGKPYSGMNWVQLIYETRNVAARYFLGGSAYHNDPDVIVVRESGGAGIGYTFDEARTLTTACVLCGGVTMLSDNLPELSAERLALLNNREVYDLIGTGKSAIPIDLFDYADIGPSGEASGTGLRLTIDQVPKIWYLPIDEKTCAVGIFNWGNTPNYVTLDFSSIGRADGTYGLRDMWAGSDLGEHSGSYSVMLMPHACQLIKIVG